MLHTGILQLLGGGGWRDIKMTCKLLKKLRGEIEGGQMGWGKSSFRGAAEGK